MLNPSAQIPTHANGAATLAAKLTKAQQHSLTANFAADTLEGISLRAVFCTAKLGKSLPTQLHILMSAQTLGSIPVSQRSASRQPVHIAGLYASEALLSVTAGRACQLLCSLQSPRKRQQPSGSSTTLLHADEV